MTSRPIEKMLEETRERTHLDVLDKMIRNTEFPVAQIFDALEIPVEKREKYLEILSSAMAQRAQREET